MQAKDLDQEIFTSEVSPFSIFRGKIGYFLDPQDAELLRFRFLSGVVTDDMDDATYIFSTKDKLVPKEAILREIIESKWIADCFLHGQLLSEEDYIVRKIPS